MTTKQSILLALMLSVSIMTKCQNKPSEEYFDVVNNHIQNGVLNDIILIYSDKYGELPDSLDGLVELYREGETSFGLDKNSIVNYIIDPFSGEKLKYIKTSKNSFILYSVGYDGIDDNAGLNNLKDHVKVVEGFKALDKNNPPKGDIMIYNYYD